MLRGPVDSGDVMLSVALAISAEEEQKRVEGAKNAAERAAAIERDEQLARQLQAVEETTTSAFPAGTSSFSAAEPTMDMELERNMSQRLSGATFVRHVPKVNSTDFDSDQTSSTEDRQRLLEKLKSYGLMEREIKGDGNCQFSALADQLWGDPQMHAEVRARVVNHLRQHPQIFAAHVPEDYATYCSSKAKSGTWGDHVTLQAAADAYGVRINVVSSYAESSFIEIVPHGGERSQRALYLSFWAEVHYNSIYPASEPPRQLQETKILGSRKLYKLFRGPQGSHGTHGSQGF